MNTTKISTSSWHYRWLGHLGLSHPRSICPYFWKVFFTSALPLMISLTGIGLALMFPNAFGMTFFWVIAGAIYFGTLFLIRGGAVYLGGLPWNRRRVGGRQLRGPNLVMSYIKAKKNNVCPLIEYTGGD